MATSPFLSLDIGHIRMFDNRDGPGLKGESRNRKTRSKAMLSGSGFLKLWKLRWDIAISLLGTADISAMAGNIIATFGAWEYAVRTGGTGVCLKRETGHDGQDFRAV
ncbi:hypothetical protein MCOR17_007138 [Pyricularia oryzae]|nr:hypothetical protein MCOR17_007138 [Pyricularia oryzae]